MRASADDLQQGEPLQAEHAEPVPARDLSTPPAMRIEAPRIAWQIRKPRGKAS